jgi:hypothetical protein
MIYSIGHTQRVNHHQFGIHSITNIQQVILWRHKMHIHMGLYQPRLPTTPPLVSMSYLRHYQISLLLVVNVMGGLND